MKDTAALCNVTTQGGLGAYLAVPSSGSGPGLVVIPEWWGLNEQIQRTCDRFAEAGFVAIAPDIFAGTYTDVSEEGAQLSRELDAQVGTERTEQAVNFLLDDERVRGEAVGAVGYCMGGGYVFRIAAAAGDKIKAAAPFYGLPGPEFQPEKVRAEVQAHFAELDQWSTPAKARDLGEQIRAKAGVEVEVIEYPNAQHAFCNEDNPSGAYSPDNSEKAWATVIDFFKEKLG